MHLQNWINTELFQEIKSLLQKSLRPSINQIQKWANDNPTAPISELITSASLQIKYKEKLQITDKWLLTEKNAQQASSYAVAEYNGSIMQEFTKCADLCCGIGMDLWAIAKNKTECFAIDLSPEILSFAKYNMSLYPDRNINFLNMKAEDFTEPVECIFIDPDRRFDDKRSNNPFNMSPNLTALEGIAQKYSKYAIKLSPMLDYDKYDFFKDGQLHFVQEHNELKEILFCSADLSQSKAKKCVLLPENISFIEDNEKNTHVIAIKKYLYEPVVSIIKAHLIENLAAKLNLNKIDQKLALLTSDITIESPFVKRYEVFSIMDFSLKKLNAFIAEHDIGYLDIKTRGFSETVESFRKKIKIKKGKKNAVLFILKMDKKHQFIIANFTS